MALTSSCNTKVWVEQLNEGLELSVKLEIYDHNLIKKCQLYTLDKLVNKELYNISLCLHHKGTMKNYLKQQI